MDRWVAPYISEGLGNRLFQYACAKEYSEKKNIPLVFLLPRTARTNHGKYSTIFKLFPETPVIETANTWNQIDELNNSHYEYNELKDEETPILIHGYRQSWKYFSSTHIEPNFSNVITKERLEYLNSKYLQIENLFFIHIRLGDFRVLPHHQINIAKYYVNAIQRIPENCNILLFSDEPE